MIGRKLGSYEIVAKLGEGGMGEVYRARDTRLNRTVAIKVLSPELTHNLVARQRFEREARAIAALSHPHICPLFDIGQQDGAEFLVMEYLDGETLAARLDRGALPLDLAMRYATEITDALARAHQQGIVHRDLKPGNIMLTKSGAKLLDFGLAKTGVTPILGTEATVSKTRDLGLTKHGAIMGTLPYMAPELLEGKDADTRSDIFALGAVVYEMVTGHRAFAEASEAALISAILQREPQSMSRIQVLTPPALERTVKTCLAKDPDDRFQSAHDVLLQFRWLSDGDSVSSPEPASLGRRVRAPLAWAIGLVAAVVLLAVLVAVLWTPRSPAPLGPVRFSIPGSVSSAYSEAIRPAVSPDGKHLAFEVLDANRRDVILLQSMGSAEVRPVPGTDKGFDVFWSPDGRSFGFFAPGKLKVVSIASGAATTLADAPRPAGGSWGPDGVILFASDGRIHSIPEGGGRSTPVTTVDPAQGETHGWPSFLPDGRHFLYVVGTTDSAEQAEPPRVYVGTLGSSDRTLVSDVHSRALYTASGHLLFVRGGILSAAPFDLTRFQLTDAAKPIGGVMHSKATGSAHFSASRNGVLALQPMSAPSRLFWFNRNGKPEAVIGEAPNCENLRISPDGDRVAVAYTNPVTDTGEIWVRGLTRATSTRLTFGQQPAAAPVWAPDGLRIAYASGRPGARDIYLKTLGDSDKDAGLLIAPGDQRPVNWSPDGRFLSYDVTAAGSGTDMWLLPGSGTGPPIPFVQTPANECCGHFSPDGRWIAYMSNESGQNEVYVKPFPGRGPSIQLSTTGGRKPRWRPDGKELFYLEEQKMMAVDTSARTAIGSQPARMLFEVDAPILAWDVTADGNRFLLATFTREDGFPPITVIVDWPASLAQR